MNDYVSERLQKLIGERTLAGESCYSRNSLLCVEIADCEMERSDGKQCENKMCACLSFDVSDEEYGPCYACIECLFWLFHNDPERLIVSSPPKPTKHSEEI